MSYTRAANPIWWLPDLTGFPLNDQYYAFFLMNDLPYDPQPVYQTPNGNVWANPLQFLPSGTLPNNLYFDDNLVYRIEIRQGDSSSAPLVWLIENFAPNGGGGGVTPGTTPFADAENMITNPQFADVFFVSPFTYTNGAIGNYTVQVGPGWFINLVGMGQITLNKYTFASPPAVGNPSYGLEIFSTGWTSVQLIQQFQNNAFIYQGGAIAVAFTAVASAAAAPITVTYVPSSAPDSTLILTQSIGVGTFKAYGGAVNITNPPNNDSSAGGYVNIVFTIPTETTFYFTNMQVVGQTTPLEGTISPSDAPIYREQTYQRTVDQEFNVYRYSLLTQAKDNLLTGWTFGLNPFQFMPNIRTLTQATAQSSYIADQTILYQETANTLAAGGSGNVFNYGLQVTANSTVNANRFAIIQYIDAKTIAPYWGQNLSCMVRALWVHTTNSSPPLAAPQLKMRLIWNQNVPTTIGPGEPIVGWTTSGDLTFSSTWTQIAPLDDPNYTLFNSSTLPFYPGTNIPNTNQFPIMAYNRFLLPQQTTSVVPAYLGVVIYINTPLNNVTDNGDSVIFDRVSLVPNDFAIDASPETFDSSLRKCQAYYEKSYDVMTPVASSTFQGASTVYTPGFAQLYGLERPFKVEKISIPTVVFYSINTPVTANAVTNIATGLPVTVTPGLNAYSSTKSTGLPTVTAVFENAAAAQWIADSRLGR